MSEIVKSLRDMIVARGGSGAGIQTIDKAVDALVAIENANNPLTALALDVDDLPVDLLGKSVTDLQFDISFDGDTIYGNLKYIDDYTGWSGNPELQKGWYIALHVDVAGESGVSYTGKLTDEKPLDQDQTVILRITNPEAQYFTVTASKSGCVSVKKVYSLKGLTLLPEED